MNQPRIPDSLPEDENMDPVGEHYPKQKRIPLSEGDRPLDLPFSHDTEVDIPRAPEKKSKLPTLLIR